MYEQIPIFPLAGALLLPHGRLPLNIFEPRYVAMVDYALRHNRLIGMIQPRTDGTLYSTGCIGRIVEWAETNDGRFLITLKGETRFKHICEEPLHTGGFRVANIETTSFITDKNISDSLCVDRTKLCGLLRQYFARHDMNCAWEKIDDVLDQELLTCLAMVCPFDVPEKQALLEAYDDCARLELFMTMLDLQCHGDCGCAH